MKEKPIIFSAPIIKAILEGRCTMTRRVVKDPRRPSRERDALLSMAPGRPDIGDIERDLELSKNIKPNFPCPYGQVGDRLWVRETWATEKEYDHLKPTDIPTFAFISYKASKEWGSYIMPIIGKTRVSIFMPRWASRLTLEITGLRAERLQELNVEDARKEGYPLGIGFAKLWDSLNAKRGYGWETNPWVWAISFKVVK